MPCSRSPGGMCIPACIAGGIPACLAAGLGGVKVAEFPKLALIHGILLSLLI